MLPSVDELLDGAIGFAIPLVTPFRGTRVREGLLLRGPVGWAEFAPFPEYGADESARWLSAAIEAGWIGWPDAVRDIGARERHRPRRRSGRGESVGARLRLHDGEGQGR